MKLIRIILSIVILAVQLGFPSTLLGDERQVDLNEQAQEQKEESKEGIEEEVWIYAQQEKSHKNRLQNVTLFMDEGDHSATTSYCEPNPISAFRSLYILHNSLRLDC